MKTEYEMVRELNDINIQIYKVKGTEIIETCTNNAYQLEFKSIEEAYNYHMGLNELN